MTESRLDTDGATRDEIQAGLRRNQGFAYEAMVAARDAVRMPLDPANPTPELDVEVGDFGAWAVGRYEQIWTFAHGDEMADLGVDEHASTALVHRLASAARAGRYRGPGAMVAVAFAHLAGLGIQPLDFMHVVGKEHAFLVVGRALPSRPEDEVDDIEGQERDPNVPRSGPASWGPQAVICDPARGVVLTVPEVLNTDYYDDYALSESQLRFEELLADVTDY